MTKQVVNQSDSGTSASMMGGSTNANMAEVNKGYIFANCFVVSLGFMQFGIGMNSWSTLANAFAYLWGWDDSNSTLLNDISQSSIILGAAVGALCCARFLAYGKLKLLYALNIILLVGVSISMIG